VQRKSEHQSTFILDWVNFSINNRKEDQKFDQQTLVDIGGASQALVAVTMATQDLNYDEKISKSLKDERNTDDLKLSEVMKYQFSRTA